MATARLNQDTAPPATAQLNPETAPPASVAAASVELPSFFREAPDAWFSVIESAFFVMKVTDPVTKYMYAVSKLDAETAVSVQELLCARITEDSYGELRRQLCDLYEQTPEQRLDELLSLTSLGDKKPSRFALEMDRLLAGQTLEDIKIRILFRCLPRQVATAISGQAFMTYRDLVVAADRAWSCLDESSRISVNRIDFDAPGGQPGRQRRIRHRPHRH